MSFVSAEINNPCADGSCDIVLPNTAPATERLDMYANTPAEATSDQSNVVACEGNPAGCTMTASGILIPNPTPPGGGRSPQDNIAIDSADTNPLASTDSIPNVGFVQSISNAVSQLIGMVRALFGF